MRPVKLRLDLSIWFGWRKALRLHASSWPDVPVFWAGSCKARQRSGSSEEVLEVRQNRMVTEYTLLKSFRSQFTRPRSQPPHGAQAHLAPRPGLSRGPPLRPPRRGWRQFRPHPGPGSRNGRSTKLQLHLTSIGYRGSVKMLFLRGGSRRVFQFPGALAL